jgi:CxxC-x17-CxxC domain-containing protein
MGNFNRDNRSSGRRDFGRRDFGRRSFGSQSGPREMFKAVCSSCGKDCEVPFQPTGSKPVFCSDCFEKNGRGNDSRRFSDRGSRNDFNPRYETRPPVNEQFGAINRKLDQILEMLNSSSLKEVKKATVVAKKKSKSPKDISPDTAN